MPRRHARPGAHSRRRCPALRRRPRACRSARFRLRGPSNAGASRPAVFLVGTPREQGICVCRTAWTNVLHRDGRRSRPWRADVAQLVAHHLAKVRVAGSNPVIRSRMQWHQPQRWSGRVVRQRPAKPCTRVRFPSPPPKLLPARLAQRESASLTRKRSLVQSQYRAPALPRFKARFTKFCLRPAPLVRDFRAQGLRSAERAALQGHGAWGRQVPEASPRRL